MKSILMDIERCYVRSITLDRQVTLFGSGNLTGPFPYLSSPNGLIGKHVEDLGPLGQDELKVSFENKSLFGRVQS